MEEYTIITQGNSTYLETTLGADELLDEVDRGMLVSNQISGLLPLSVQWINAGCRLLYNITGLTPLEQAARILEHETRLSNFFLALCKAEKECDEYLLDPHKIDLSPKHIYLDATGSAFVMYHPVQAVQSNYDPMELTRFVFRLVGQQMPQDSRVANVLSRQLLYGGSFTFAELEQQIKERPNPKPQPAPVQEEQVRPAPMPPVQRSERIFEPVKTPQPENVIPQQPSHAPEAGQQDNPFARNTADNPFAASQSEPEQQPQPMKDKKDKKAEKNEKGKKSGGLFGGLFGGKKDKKKHAEEEQENPFQQEAPVPEPSVYKSVSAAPAYVPPQSSGGRTVVLSSGQSDGNVRTTIMGAGSGASRELYLVQKDTNQYIHVTHTNFHIGRAEDVVDFTVRTKNCYLGNDHAYILLKDGNYYIVDNNTQNSTYLNEQRLEPSKPTQFHAGDTIRMADIVFSVVAGS